MLLRLLLLLLLKLLLLLLLLLLVYLLLLHLILLMYKFRRWRTLLHLGLIIDSVIRKRRWLLLLHVRRIHCLIAHLRLRKLLNAIDGLRSSRWQRGRKHTDRRWAETERNTTRRRKERIWAIVWLRVRKIGGVMLHEPRISVVHHFG